MISNPFSIPQLRKEIKSFNVPEYEDDGVRTVTRPLLGPVPEFFNNWFWTDSDRIKIPMFLIDGKTWMSLTPMEMQSAHVPLMCARGVVGTSGLGMGYFALRAAQKPNVEKVYAYEIDPRVIRYFNECYHDREGFDKVHIVEGDVRECRGNTYDSFFMDPYLIMLPDEALSDARMFTSHNSVGRYHFWGQEKCYLHLFFDPYASDEDKQQLVMCWPDEIRWLVHVWFNQVRTVNKKRRHIYGLYDDMPMTDYANEAVQLLSELMDWSAV